MGSVLPGGGGTGDGSRGGFVMSSSRDKGMPADWRAFPHVQDPALFVHLLLVRFLGRLLIGLLVRLLPILALLLLALLALTLLLVTVLRGLLRVAVLGIVHR
jgi:hypothetical protein